MSDNTTRERVREGAGGPWPDEAAFRDHRRIAHELSPHFAALRAIPTREALYASPLWARIGPEVGRVLEAVEQGTHPLASGPRVAGRLRVVAWNVQRGARLEALRSALVGDPVLAEADVLLLVEVDLGMGRSGNRNVARELAEGLGMSYAFVVSYLALEDDFGENPEGRESTLALAGQAILSRVPLRRVENVDVPELRDKFSSSEKRLGKKRALLAELELPDGPLTVCACHLDSNASPAQRAHQLDAILARAEAAGHPRVLVGGDLNTTTYDTSGPWALAKDLLHKLFTIGFKGTLDNYLTPDLRYERPVFETLARRGLAIEGFNDRDGARGTMDYDFNQPYAVQKVRTKVGGLLTRLLLRQLRPWRWVVAARLDWFAGKGVTPARAYVARWRDAEGRAASDHEAIVVDVDPAPGSARRAGELAVGGEVP